MPTSPHHYSQSRKLLRTVKDLSVLVTVVPSLSEVEPPVGSALMPAGEQMGGVFLESALDRAGHLN